MSKILQATVRGQVTLPKGWRDQYDTQYFLSEVDGDSLILKPLLKNDFEDSVEAAWAQYKKKEYVTSEDLMEEYGL